jgi:quercetin dioxygenase-like cupin family protein
MRLIIASLLLAAPSHVHKGDFTEGNLRVTHGAPDGGCQLKVDDVVLVAAPERCAITPFPALEKFSVGTIGEATFVARSDPAYAGRLSLNAGAEVKPHKHDTSVEIVVVQSGRGTFTIDGAKEEVGPGDEILIPKGATHGFIAGKEPVKIVQFYAPPGPEERFRTKEKKP